MNLSIGSDHRGVETKSKIGEILSSMGHSIDDCGAWSAESCDYPDIAHLVASKIGGGESERGVLICGSGIGMSIAANKTHGVRAALCHDRHAAEMSRRHNDANVLCLSADHLDQLTQDAIVSLITTWMETEFEGGRHQRRVDKIALDSDSACHD